MNEGLEKDESDIDRKRNVKPLQSNLVPVFKKMAPKYNAF